MKKIKENEFYLLKSKDDFSFEHYKTSPLSNMTGFIGTAGEGIMDYTGKIFLFVDSRYHIQADIQTKGKNVEVIKMPFGEGFVESLKKFMPKNSTLFVPSKSTSFLMYEKLKKTLDRVELKTYDTKDDKTSIQNPENPIFEVPLKIVGISKEEKIKKLKPCKNILVTNLENIAYILNLRSYKTENASTFRAKFFIEDENKIYIFTDYKLPFENKKFIIKKMKEYEDFIKSVIEPINLDTKEVSIYDFHLVRKPQPIKKNKISLISSKKNAKEINHYIESFRRLDLALYGFRERIQEGLSEFELNQIFEEELKKNGAFCTSFKTILAIGENSSVIHYTACSKEKILKKEELILLDCGGYYEGGLATDITRVFYFGDNPSLEIKKIYTAVLKTQLRTYHSPSIMTDELHNLASKMLKKYEKEGFYFPHGLGHGIGIPVHQAPPTLSSNVHLKLKNGNVFTIEPGLYKQSAFGIRLENTVYLKNNKKASLSHFPYEEKLIIPEMLSKKELLELKNWQEGFKI